MIQTHWNGVWHAHDRDADTTESTSLCGEDHWVGGETKTPGGPACLGCLHALKRRVNGEPDPPPWWLEQVNVECPQCGGDGWDLVGLTWCACHACDGAGVVPT